MRVYQNIFVTILFSLLVISCSEEEVGRVSEEVAFINEVEAPETAMVNQVVAIEVTFSMRNTCGSFKEFREISAEEGKIIEVLVDYRGRACGQAIIEETQIYEFTPPSAGTYELNFRSSTGDLISVNIQVTAQS